MIECSSEQIGDAHLVATLDHYFGVVCVLAFAHGCLVARLHINADLVVREFLSQPASFRKLIRVRSPKLEQCSVLSKMRLFKLFHYESSDFRSVDQSLLIVVQAYPSSRAASARL